MEITVRGIKKKLLYLLMFMVIFAAAPGKVAAADLQEGAYYTLTILHTNDIHGHVDDLPKYASVVKQVRSEAQNFLLLDGGDIFLRGEFEDLQGKVEMDILNAMNYDAWVLGNNDFRVKDGGTVNQGNSLIQSLAAQANFPTLCANVYMKDSSTYIENVDPYTIQDVNGVKVGIIGVTSLKPQDRGWEEVSDKVFESGEITVANLIDEVSAQSDIQIVLSHTGIQVDFKMAAVAGVDAVLGADDHYIIPQPIYMSYDGTKTAPITQNGGEGEHYLGRLDLVFRYIGGEMQLVDVNGFLYHVEFVEEDPEIAGIIDQYRYSELGRIA